MGTVTTKSNMASSLDAASLFRVDGMVAVVTGGGSGIGLTMARALAVNGARKVYLLGRRLPVLEAAAASHPDILVPLQCDVTSKPSLQAAVDRIASEVGFLNLVIANSGIIGPTTNRWDPKLSLAELRQKLFVETSMEEMTETFHVNVTGAYFTLLAFLELLDKGNEEAVERGGFGRPSVEGGRVPSVQSQVVVTSSIAAFSRNGASTPGYAGSKAAVMHLVKHASSQMARFGVRANAMCPGLFPSELAAGIIGDRKPEEEEPSDPRFIPARHFGTDEEMAGSILYLASRAGAFCNGLALVNDGGRLAVMGSTY